MQSNLALLLPSTLALLALLQSPTAQKPAAPVAQAAPAQHSALVPAERLSEDWWKQRFEAANARAKQGDIGLIFLGDSITQGWENEGKEVWAKYYEKRKADNLGFSGDRTQHVLWRLDHGNVDGLDKPAAEGKAIPKLVVLMIGTNNSNGSDNTAREIADGVQAIVAKLRAKLPQAKVLVLGIFPRGEKPNEQRAKNDEANKLVSAIADDKSVFYLDIGPAFLSKDGTIDKAIMPDFLHLSPRGYALWAEAMDAKVSALLK